MYPQLLSRKMYPQLQLQGQLHLAWPEVKKYGNCPRAFLANSDTKDHVFVWFMCLLQFYKCFVPALFKAQLFLELSYRCLLMLQLRNKLFFFTFLPVVLYHWPGQHFGLLFW